MNLEASVESFVAAATSGRCGRARRLLDARPQIAADPWAKLVLGRGAWEGDPVKPGGPNGWAPLLYVTHSCFASVELARDLLARGADPDATFTNEYGEMSAIYGAAGVVHDPELTRLLLEHGANPDDGESLYHATEAPDSACLRILLEHGASPACTNALAHAIDGERGRDDLAAVLEELGADTTVAGEDLAVAALRRGEPPARPLPASLSADAREVLILAALDDRLELVAEVLGAGFMGRVGGSPPGSLLHHACWVGDPALVRRLLELGADPLLSGDDFGAPIFWAALGSQWYRIEGRDYVGVVETLLAAGAELDAHLAEVAEGPLAAWLEERGVG